MMNLMDKNVIAFMMPQMKAIWGIFFLILWMKKGMKKEMANNRRNEVRKETDEGTFTSLQKVGIFGKVQNVTFSMMLGCSLQVGL